ncbi:MAG: methionyl-tRNA formyltransferase [candidate division WOR-3 bacterium]|nr:methionyl-tRNA formyltransferase [candidate division WOR-3 bacterium]MDW8113512.1 methionyl-tRNA formyltransferase [candidate division WOR-3 bacterium]
MKIIFFGSDDLGIPGLETLLKNNYEVIGVITTPDKPKGRGLKILPNPIKEKAQELFLKIFQPPDPNDRNFISLLKELKPNLGILISYGKILKKELIEIFEKGIINIHFSLLPKYRGAAPIQRALLAGEKETGLTAFLLNEKLDAGPIIYQEKIEIKEDDNYGSLKERLKELSKNFLIKAIRKYLNNEPLIYQNEALATYAPKIKKEERKINWEKEKEKIFNQIRAFSPTPGAYTIFHNEQLIILKSEIPLNKMNNIEKLPCGGILIFNKGLYVKCTNSFLRIKELKPSGKKVMSDLDFINGYRIKSGDAFSN